MFEGLFMKNVEKYDYRSEVKYMIFVKGSR